MSGFGTRIRARRNRLALTLRDVEMITNGMVSNAYLSQLENGKIRNPSAKIVLALAAAYHVEPAEMLQWVGEKTEIIPPPLCPTCGSTWKDRLGVVEDPRP